MRTMSISYPEEVLSVLNQSPESFEHEAPVVLAVKLFELGRLTSGQAADFAGIPRTEFLLTCHRYGTPSVEWDSAELKAELQGSRP